MVRTCLSHGALGPPSTPPTCWATLASTQSSATGDWLRKVVLLAFSQPCLPGLTPLHNQLPDRSGKTLEGVAALSRVELGLRPEKPSTVSATFAVEAADA